MIIIFTIYEHLWQFRLIHNKFCQFETFFFLLPNQREKTNCCLKHHRAYIVFPKCWIDIDSHFSLWFIQYLCANSHDHKTMKHVQRMSFWWQLFFFFACSLNNGSICRSSFHSYISRRPTRFCRGNNFRCRTWTTPNRIEWREDNKKLLFKMEQLL